MLTLAQPSGLPAWLRACLCALCVLFASVDSGRGDTAAAGASTNAPEAITLIDNAGAVGQAPPGWRITTPVFSARTVRTSASAQPGAPLAIEFVRTPISDTASDQPSDKPTDKQVAQLPAEPAESTDDIKPGIMLITLSPTQVRAVAGQTVAFSANVQVGEASHQAQLWLRVDRPDGEPGFFENMAAAPILPGARARKGLGAPANRGELAEERTNPLPRRGFLARIESDADSVTVGVILHGGPGAAVRISELLLVPLVPTAEAGLVTGDRPAAALTPQASANIAAAGQFVAALRYFHPSSVAERTNFDALLLDVIEQAEPCETAQQLADVLTVVANQIAVGVSISVQPRGASIAAPVQIAPVGNAAQPFFAAWRHTGVRGASAGSIYKSQRIVEHSNTPPERSKIAGSEQPLVLMLPRGIRMVMPMRLACDGAGQTESPPIAAEASPPSNLPPRHALWLPGAADRSTRLAAVVSAWTTLDFFYPYFGDLAANGTPVDWPAALESALAEAASIDALSAHKSGTDHVSQMTDVLSRMVAKLRDGHGYVSSPGRVAADVLPLSLLFAEGQLVVASTSGEQSAQLRAGDIVTAIAGEPIAAILARKRPLVSAASAGWADHAIIGYIPRLLTPPRTTIDVMRSGAPRSIRISRVEPRQAPRPAARPNQGEEIAPGVRYFDLCGADAEALAEHIEKLADAKSVIFDLRGYPDSAGKIALNHLIRRPSRSLQMLVPVRCRPGSSLRAGPDAYAPSPGVIWNNVGPWELRPATPRIRGKVIFVTDGSAISYAESCMSIVESLKLGAIVGEPTAATNGNINTIAVPGGWTITFTGMRVTKDDGTPYHGVGTRPTHPASRTIAGIKAGKDELLDAATKLAEELIAGSAGAK